jgi:hypothetical protein
MRRATSPERLETSSTKNGNAGAVGTSPNASPASSQGSGVATAVLSVARIRPYRVEMSDARDGLPPEIRALENDVRQDPESEWLHQRLLFELCRDELDGHPGRIAHILDYIERFPRSVFARSPMVHVNSEMHPEAFEAIDALWTRLRNEDRGDPELVIGHAAIVARADGTRAAEMLRAAIALLPGDAALWTELGCIEPDPSLALEALQKARVLGSNQPNLLVWIGRAAVDAERWDDVLGAGAELTARAAQTRAAISFPVAWDDTGRGSWERVCAALEHSPDRSELVSAFSSYANDTHWGFTFLGLVAAEQGQLLDAGEQLRRSAKVWAEFRLSSYGPSCLLARKLCEAGMWKDVEEYLVACEDIWDDDVLDDWLEDVRNERIPDFDEP